MRVAAAVPRMQVADTQFNTNEIIDLIHRAAEEQVEVVCFPELCVTGYTCADLFFQRQLQENALQAMERICQETKGLPLMAFTGLISSSGERVAPHFSHWSP